MSIEPTTTTTTITGTKLLDLTPVCLQNTNNIMNTLIFMCLDQGHDFRDKSDRTLTSGVRGWVDIDFRGDGYLNKISEEDLSTYITDEGDNNSIGPDKIFGKQQFVKGLINTTFKGGNGAYGLVIVDNQDYNIISSQSASDSATGSAPDSAPDSASDSATGSAPDSASDSATGSATGSAPDSASGSVSDSATGSEIGSATGSISDSATGSEIGSATGSVSDSATDSAPDSASDSAPDSASDSATGSASDSATASTSESVVKDNAVSNFIVGKLREKIQSADANESITFYFGTSDENYYILSGGDDGSSEGRTISDTLRNKPVSFLFLPLYKRAYNKGMHKLWTFNTKKHIFVVNLDKIYIKRTRRNDSLYFTINSNKTEISCKKLTTIDLIIPTYTIIDFQKTFLTGVSEHLKSHSVFSESNQNLLTPSKINDLFNNTDVTEEQKEVILNYFLKSLFEGGDGISKSDSSGTPSIQYNIDASGAGYFTLKNNDKLYKCVPRGAKYWFEKSRTSAFKHFIRLLYAHQKPFIHPKYNISNAAGNLDKSKEYILNTLLGPADESKTNLDKYIAYKNEGVEFDGTSPFILKQYGVIPDTTIGTESSGTTINHLINSLNNVPNDTTCEPTNMVGGGDLDYLKTYVDIKKQSNIKTLEESVKRKIFDTTTQKAIEVILKALRSNDQETVKLIEYLKEKFDPNEVDAFLRTKDMQTPTSDAKADAEADAEPGAKPPADFSFASPTLGVTTDASETASATVTMTDDKSIPSVQADLSSASPTSVVTTVASETASIPTIQAEAKPVSTVYFDNINNVNRDFNLGLSADTIKSEPFVKIGSEIPNKNIELYETEYANSLQQYYDFIPQTNSSGANKNYFKNCWQTIDFFEEKDPKIGQTGGERYQYPYRFTVTSGQIDGSLQGGQSIPQYHPPEVDIYMPIFELEGDGKLKGIIARMVFVKEILANAVNSKSRAVVFCHFAYVDFNSLGKDDIDNVSEYPAALKELLEYTVNNTYYVNTNDECINLEALNANPDINADDQIDFEIELRNPKTPSSIGVRKWYKYYTYTSGPGVKEHFVPPTNYNNIGDILHFSKDVANRIANVGDKLIKNSGKLRKAFGAPEDVSTPTQSIDEHPGAVLFVKLFLIRNKYTGDKSRATDTLFLNQTKYLEGIQISNDENTLFNANMFGQNTIWSTSKQTVFNMSPYLTKSGKMPINGGFYIDTLCESLRGNPSIKIEAIQSEESATDDALIRDEYKTSIVNKISGTDEIPGLYEKCELKGKKLYTNFQDGLIDALISYNNFQEKYNDLSKYYNNYDKNLNKLLISMTNIIQQQNADTGRRIITNWSEGSGFVQQGTIGDNKTTGVGSSIITTTGNALKALGDAKTKIVGFLNLLINFANQVKKNCSKFSNKDLNNLILYITQNISWWNIDEYKNIIIDRYCYMCSAFLCQVVENCKRDTCYQKVGYYFTERMNDMINNINKALSDSDIKEKVKDCLSKFNFNVSLDTASTTVIELITKGKGVCPPTKPDETGKIRLEVTGDSSKEEIFQNEEKLKLLTPGIIDILLSNDARLSSDKQKLDAINALVNRVLGITTDSTLTLQQTTRADATERYEQGTRRSNRVKSVKVSNAPEETGVNVTDTPTEQQNTGKGRRKRGGMNGNIDAEELNLFYENSYKCNVGNYLKSFIKLITSINKQYIDLNINENDTVKDIIVKILLKDINLINSSYTPLLNADKIVDTINKIDGTYTVEQMNTIKNLYSSQLELYSLINTVINIDYQNVDEREYLVDLINENINENRYNDLNLPFSKKQLFDKIVNNQEQLQQPVQQPSISSTKQITEKPNATPLPNPWLTNTSNSKKDVSHIDFSSILNKYNIGTTDSSQTRKYPNYSNYPERLNNLGQMVMVHGGSIKHKRKQVNKTRTNKRKNKKGTIRKRKVRVRKYTRRR